MAVKRSMGWAIPKKKTFMTGITLLFFEKITIGKFLYYIIIIIFFF